jgi:hypothetical protein
MRRHVLPTATALLFIAASLWAATPGTFRGIVITGPDHDPGWIMVKGANGQMRRVKIASAQVVYAETVPSRERQQKPESSIVHGAEIRVTADQDENGEWRAQRIEILKLKADPPIEPSARSENIHST